MVSENSDENAPHEFVFDRLRSYFSQDAAISIIVNRNEQDSYAIRIMPGGANLAPHLTEADVIALLPVGSSWLQSVGWHSYFGIPFRFDGEIWLAIGAELIKRHHSRGAYVSLLAFIFPRHRIPIRRLAKLAKELRSTQLEEGPDETVGSQSVIFDRARRFLAGGFGKVGFRSDRYRVVEASSRTPVEHVRIEARIIHDAMELYDKKELLLFRTLILAKNELHQPPSLFSCSNKQQPLARLQICYHKYLAATVPGITGIISSQTRCFQDSAK